MKWLFLCRAAILQSQWPTWFNSSFPLQFSVPQRPPSNVGLLTFNLTSPSDSHCDWMNVTKKSKSTKDEFLCGLRESLQPKVNGAHSTCHGLHGCKIKIFSSFKVQGLFFCIAIKEFMLLTFVALWRNYFGFHWNGTKLLEMSPIKKKKKRCEFWSPQNQRLGKNLWFEHIQH